LENNDELKDWETHFWTAYDALSYKKLELIEEGIRRAIAQQQAIIRQGLSVIANRNIVISGPFRHAFLPNTSDIGYFNHPLALTRLASFVLDSLTQLGGKAKDKPLVVAVPNMQKNIYILVGITVYPAISTSRNQFGLSYEAAVLRTNSRIKAHYFDSGTIGVLRDDVKKFMDFLHAGPM